ncbi:hypothetical protein DesyoDRAFT_0140 [Desulfosporosinus youngiae DSM 17734]|uniref:Uncharacterized protein n=1 Tax=Desulfosporosinus youngiae DSM 17734 TaxID=768710 RepID=H5Y0Y1_9FIRM|nr:hypothetical protein DesyoDRAFT_0140 [Desulfosporosinus youngiae DSM 17734]
MAARRPVANTPAVWIERVEPRLPKFVCADEFGAHPDEMTKSKHLIKRWPFAYLAMTCFPGSYAPSILGPEGLNFRVRYTKSG